MRMTDWVQRYKTKRAIWTHDGTKRRPHALISRKRGQHTGIFFHSELVMEDARILDAACFDLMQSLRLHRIRLDSIDRVVSATGAIPLAYSISQQVGYQSGRSCLHAHAERGTNGDGKKVTIHSGERVLVVEDVLATGANVGLTTEAVIGAGGIVLPVIGALVNRSGLDEVDGKKIVALIESPAPTWTQESCPLCKNGSRAVCPRANWAILNAP